MRDLSTGRQEEQDHIVDRCIRGARNLAVLMRVDEPEQNASG